MLLTSAPFSLPPLSPDRSILTLWNVCSHSPSLEKLAAEGGAAALLLDAECNAASWPTTLRDMAGGCLGFLAERHSNLK